MRTHAWVWIGVLALAPAACSENPALGPDDHEETLTVELTIDPGHAHTLAPVTFRAVVLDGHGSVVTEFDTLRVERLAAATTTWRTAAELTLVGNAFEGEATFVSSGEYELRVMGLQHGQAAMAEIPMATHMDPFQVGRAHVEESGIRVEFETFPGHIHEGDEVEMRFWVLELERNTAGVRPAISGLQAEIRCIEAGATEAHVAVEHEAGVYEATHLFSVAGEGSAEITVETENGPVLVEFPLHVASRH